MGEVKERGILFSAPMVLALLEGRKTQTRRVLQARHLSGTGFHQPTHASGPTLTKCIGQYCPYGQPGDRLWVRETWAPFNVWAHPPDNSMHTARIRYAAGGPDFTPLITTAQRQQVKRWGEPGKDVWVPSIHMFRWASRITLEVTEVRVQRLQEISEEDAVAEGVMPVYDVRHIALGHTARGAYAALWDSINGDGAWEKNPWCWAVSFKVLSVASTGTGG